MFKLSVIILVSLALSGASGQRIPSQASEPNSQFSRNSLWCEENEIKVHGPRLVWCEDTCTWFSNKLNRANDDDDDGASELNARQQEPSGEPPSTPTSTRMTSTTTTATPFASSSRANSTITSETTKMPPKQSGGVPGSKRKCRPVLAFSCFCERGFARNLLTGGCVPRCR